MRKISFDMFRIVFIFVLTFTRKDRETCQFLTGIFYVCTLHIRRFRTPVLESIMLPLPLR